jgi:hypothetical protein
MPTTGFLSQLDVTTNKKLLSEVVDGVFKADPVLAYLKQNQLDRWSGTAIQSPFLYGRLPGLSYAKGQNFDITQPQTKNAGTWQPKYEAVSVSLFLEDVEVENAGPTAVIKEATSRLQEAALNMSERLAIALYRHGQNLAADNRSLKIHGLSEALNDGSTAGWDGNTFPNYGTIARADVRLAGLAAGQGALDAKMGATAASNPAANVNGTITYDLLERFYNSIVIGTEKPNLIATTNLGMSYIKKKFQPQQRFETDSPAAGFTGLKFNGAMVIQSQYAPGTEGLNLGGNVDAGQGNFLTTAGETLWFLNTKFFTFWVANSPKYAFGFTGWKPAQDNTVIAGQYLYGGPGLTCKMPRFSRYAFGITG